MAQLPTSLGLPQPSVSDGGDLLRMAVLMSKESADSLNKSFDDFKSTMTTSANRQLASAFANGIASGLSPDEAFKQASGNINSWTSAESINNALMQRNMEKEALLRENQDRRAEERARRENLDWEGENSASESNLLYQRAYAENNKKLYDQATALANSLDAIGKKYAKPTDLAGRQDTFATNAMNRARAKADMDGINEELMAKELQARYAQYMAAHPDQPHIAGLKFAVDSTGYGDVDKAQRLLYKFGLSAGTNTLDETAKTIAAANSYTNTDAGLADYYNDSVKKTKTNSEKINKTIQGHNLTDSEKKDRDFWVQSIIPELISQSGHITNANEIDIKTAKGGIFSAIFEKGANTEFSTDQAKQFLESYLQAPNSAAREKIINNVNKDYNGIFSKSSLKDFLQKTFTENLDGSLSFTPETLKTFEDALKNQDVGGVTREEDAARNNLKLQALQIKKREADNAKRYATIQALLKQGKYDESTALLQDYKKEAENIQLLNTDFANKNNIASKDMAEGTFYKNYRDIIEGEVPFDFGTLKDRFGKDEAQKMVNTYTKANKELKDSRDKIPDAAVRWAIMAHQYETNEDEILKIAKLLKIDLGAAAVLYGTLKERAEAYKNSKDTPIKGTSE